MVSQVACAVRIPVVGVGGAASAEDVLEFICCGASAVQIGTAAFVDPGILVRTLDRLEELLRQDGTPLTELVGSLNRREAGGAAPERSPARRGSQVAP